jgi:putative ATPase
MADLFGKTVPRRHSADTLREDAPLADRLRPRADEVVGQDLTGPEAQCEDGCGG